MDPLPDARKQATQRANFIRTSCGVILPVGVAMGLLLGFALSAPVKTDFAAGARADTG
jgi:hypothetical protein